MIKKGKGIVLETFALFIFFSYYPYDNMRLSV